MNGKSLNVVGLGVILIVVASVGCGRSHPTPAPVQASSIPKPDPLADQYKKLRTADYEINDAIQETKAAVDAAKLLAPKAGGDAEKALASVVELLDGAGESLDDYEPPPDSVGEFRKDFAAQDERRISAIKTCNDSLEKINDAADILGDLSANAPDQYKKQLGTVTDNVDQARSDLQQAVVSMGGQLPDESNFESVDPVEEKGKSP